jgi:hypothetical protein
MSAPEIEHYHFGRIQIEGEVYESDVIILPDRIVPNWWRAHGHSLAIADFDGLLDELPETLIIGQGASSRMVVPVETSEKLAEMGIDVIALETDQACARYNEMREQGKVAAALHLTC